MIFQNQISDIVEHFSSFTAINISNALNKINDKFITPDVVSNELKKYIDNGFLKYNRQSFEYFTLKKIKSNLYDNLNDYIIHQLTNKYYYKLTYLREILSKKKKSKVNISMEILTAQKERLESFEKLIETIIKYQTSLSFIKEISQQEIYSEIITNENIKNDINLKLKSQGDKSRDLSSLNKNANREHEKERLLEYEVLCKKVWDDGIITKEEEIELTNKINELNIDSKIGREIFEKIKGEYFAKQDELKKPSSYKVTRVNNNKFIIKKAKLPFHPLFLHEFDRVTGNDIIKINISHDLYKDNYDEIIINFASSLYYTKLSMTDPNISRFIDRINNNLELIEYEH